MTSNEAEQVFFLGDGLASTTEGGAEAMGFKAYNLARIARIGLPLPPAFVLGTRFCRDYFSRGERLAPGFRELMAANIRRLELLSRLNFGGERRPLLVSVRSGAPVSMPGMMETILNIGLCDGALRGVLRLTGNPHLVWDCYRRLAQSFAEVVYGCPAEPFESALAEHMRKQSVEHPQELDFQSLAELTREYLKLFHSLTGKDFPQNPLDQLEQAVAAVFQSWNSPKAVEYRQLNQLDHMVGTAVTVQRMVFGNSGGNSGAGVAFTRDPATGENNPYLDFLANAQGEDIASGRHLAQDPEQLMRAMPGAYQEILNVRQALEREFRDAQEFEFTIQEGQLFILQTRAAKRTPFAALRIAVEQVHEGLIEREEALARLKDYNLDSIKQTRLTDGAEVVVLATATPASQGVAVGEIALNALTAQQRAAAGRPVILVRRETSTSDIAGIAVAQGILTALGGRTSHAAVIARQMNKVCLVGCPSLIVDLTNRRCAIGEKWFNEGESIGLDSDTGRVLDGKVEIIHERPSAYLAEVAKWSAATPDRYEY
ncbi:MAG: pyruvate, phosphate dikinase [Chloracidobacterium sp.]|nr:pyruvate, phosphate dikinase [Chloracidobacterium sp.]